MGRQEQWLVSWIGNTDHECAEGKRGQETGPIATALQSGQRFDRVHLLTNYSHARSLAYCQWLEKLCGREVELFQVELTSPIDYAAIYRAVCAELSVARLPRDDVELTFHLSPGTPAMTAIWIILAKTRFPARLIQTSLQHGLESVDFPFDLASDFLPEFLKRSSERIERLAEGLPAPAAEFGRIVHASAAMRHQIQLARKIAVHEVPVLILGETGTGKELFAEAIHASSRRADCPFIAVNCGAIPAELANAELFGHKRGAFTGATAERKGHFQEACGGTLFLDEVGDLPLDTQVRLLRALQSHEVTPLGASRPVTVNVRILAATHRDLAAEVTAGRFREDLFHRLAVGILRLPPLREREGDVSLLIDRFMAAINADAQGQPEAQEKKLSANAKNILLAHAWPGNVRELYHTLLRATIWSAGTEVTADEARGALVHVRAPSAPSRCGALGQDFDLQGFLDATAREHIELALRQSSGRKSQAAKMLGFANYQTLSNWMKRLGVETESSNN